MPGPMSGEFEIDGTNDGPNRERPPRIWCGILTYTVKNPHQNTSQNANYWWARGDLNPHVLANTGT